MLAARLAIISLSLGLVGLLVSEMLSRAIGRRLGRTGCADAARRASQTRGDFTLETAFSAPTPGVTAIFGRSGCGKSTLISLIAWTSDSDSGRVAVGDDVWYDSERHLSVDTRHRRMGVVFQDARLFPHLSVRGTSSTACGACR
jgi:ABC-type arginine transport system ATPase subunit